MTVSQVSPSFPPATDPLATFEEGVRLAGEGRTEAAKSAFARVVEAEPGNAVAHKNLGVLMIQSGELLAGAHQFERAQMLCPDDQFLRDECIQVQFLAGAQLFRQGNIQAAIDRLRKVLRLDPHHSSARIELTTYLSIAGAPAVLGDYIPGPDVRLGKHALIACMPKSGSTLLFETMSALTGWQKAFFSYAYMQNEQELYLPNMLESASQDTVTQQHCRATSANIHLIQGFGITPIVLIRNLFDIVLSLADFYDSGAVANTFFIGQWTDLTAEEKHDAIIDHVMPWYLGFYASWQQANEKQAVDCLFLRYEDLIADKPATLLRTMDFLGVETTLADCKAAFARIEDSPAKTRLNRGIAGRGEKTLTDEQQDRIRRIASSYRKIDFSPVGL